MIGIGFIVANWVSYSYAHVKRLMPNPSQVGYGCQYLPSNTAWRLALGLQARGHASILFAWKRDVIF